MYTNYKLLTTVQLFGLPCNIKALQAYKPYVTTAQNVTNSCAVN